MVVVAVATAVVGLFLDSELHSFLSLFVRILVLSRALCSSSGMYGLLL